MSPWSPDQVPRRVRRDADGRVRVSVNPHERFAWLTVVEDDELGTAAAKRSGSGFLVLCDCRCGTRVWKRQSALLGCDTGSCSGMCCPAHGRNQRRVHPAAPATVDRGPRPELVLALVYMMAVEHKLVLEAEQGAV